MRQSAGDSNYYGQLGDGTQRTIETYTRYKFTGLNDGCHGNRGRMELTLVRFKTVRQSVGDLTISGQLGDGTQTDRKAPVQVTWFEC